MPVKILRSSSVSGSVLESKKQAELWKSHVMVDEDKHKPKFDKKYPVSEVRDPARPGRPRRVVTEKTAVIENRPVGQEAEPEIEVSIANENEKRYDMRRRTAKNYVGKVTVLMTDDEDQIHDQLKVYWSGKRYSTKKINHLSPVVFTREECGYMLFGESIVVYTDASCTKNGEDDARAGIAVFFQERSKYNFKGEILNPSQYLLDSRLTNNKAEIIAVIKALEIAHQYRMNNVEVRTDCSFVVSYFESNRELWLNQAVQNENNRRRRYIQY